MEDLVKLVNDTVFEKVNRPKYVLVLGNSNDWEKIKNGILYKYKGVQTTVQFLKFSENVFCTFWGGNAYPLMKIIHKILGHNNFFFAEVQPFIDLEDS